MLLKFWPLWLNGSPYKTKWTRGAQQDRNAYTVQDDFIEDTVQFSVPIIPVNIQIIINICRLFCNKTFFPLYQAQA